MATTIIYTLECHCGADATATVLNLDNPQPDGTIRIDVELAIGQQDFKCESCGCVLGTGDIDYVIGEAGDDCDGEV